MGSGADEGENSHYMGNMMDVIIVLGEEKPFPHFLPLLLFLFFPPI